jgi:acetyltransferase-like isoleucine patch superfamily enzyme
VVETSKAAIEIVSPGDGTLCRLNREGEEIELGHSIGLVAENDEELAAIERPAGPATTAERQSVPNATRKAVELAEQHGIDLASITKAGFITAEDVAAVVAQGDAGPALADDPTRLMGVSTDGVSLPQTFTLDETVGRLDEGFLESLRTDPDGFRALSSEDRCEAYRANGARIGEGVTLGARTLIVAPQVVLDDGVTFGDDCLVRCDEIFAVGSLTHFGPGLDVSCRRAYFGVNGHIGRRARIGGGGAHDPWGTFAAGDLLFLGDDAYVNPCRPVLIGREVFLTMRSVIVTHNIGHSVLEGFENRFAPVVLEDRAQVGIGTVVYAGCRIGGEAIVASNSYVVSDIPAGKLAVGVPARVAGSSRQPSSRERQRRLLRGMIDDLRELLELSGCDVSPMTEGPAPGIEIRHDGATAFVFGVDALTADFQPPGTSSETVVLTLELDGDPPPGCAVLDLIGRRVHGPGGAVLDSAREFCRKRGIRFEPEPWRYSGGLV